MLAWNFFTDLAHTVLDPSVPTPSIQLDCVCLAAEILDWELDPRWLGIGLLVGIAVGPLLEALLVIRQWWSKLVRRQLLAVTRSVRPLYRDL